MFSHTKIFTPLLLVLLAFSTPSFADGETCEEGHPDGTDGVVEAGYSADEVYSSSQGLTVGDTAVDSDRSSPEAALEFAEANVATSFFSLGIGGEIIVEFNCPIQNGDGDDIRVYEKTYPSTTYPTESAEVWAWSEDLDDWVSLGTATNTPISERDDGDVPNEFDLGDIEQTSLIRIVDTTVAADHSSSADGFDVNGVEALQDCTAFCDLVDNDCDGETDEGCPEVAECDQDNLVLNGSFEVVDARIGTINGNALDSLGTSSRTWDVFESLPNVTGGAGTSWYVDGTAGIEIQYSGTVIDAQDGVHYVELDSHGSSSNVLSVQSLDLDGGDYVLTFYYRPRRTIEDDSIVEVYFDDELIHTANNTDNTTWQLVELFIEDVEEGTHTVSFEGAGFENTYGGFIDNVNLSCDPSADPEDPEEDPEDPEEDPEDPEDPEDDDGDDEDDTDDDDGDDSDDDGDDDDSPDPAPAPDAGTSGDDSGAGTGSGSGSGGSSAAVGGSASSPLDPLAGLVIQGSGDNCSLNPNATSKGSLSYLSLFLLAFGMTSLLRRKANA